MTNQRPARVWTKEEIKYVYEMYEKTSEKEHIEHLNCTVSQYGLLVKYIRDFAKLPRRRSLLTKSSLNKETIKTALSELGINIA